MCCFHGRLLEDGPDGSQTGGNIAIDIDGL
jgi:hypothetical protein